MKKTILSHARTRSGSALQRKSKLVTKTGLARNGKPLRAKKPAKPGAAAQENRARELVYARSLGMCEIQLDGCTQLASDWHHRQNRSQLGKWTASNGLHLCRHCHSKVTDTQGNRRFYEQRGWIVRSGVDPAEVPVVLWPCGLVYLQDDGGIREPDPFTLPMSSLLDYEPADDTDKAFDDAA
jgi:hypothetical protein